MAEKSRNPSSCKAKCQCHKISQKFSENVLSSLEEITVEKNRAVDIKRPQSVDWDKRNELMAYLHKEVDKLSVMYTTSPLPKCKDEEKLFDGITQCILALVYSISRSSPYKGRCLHKCWHTYDISLFTTLYEFSKSLLSANKQSIAQCTGLVWEKCAAANTLPKDNKQCYVYEQKQILALVEDALAELQEAKSSSSLTEEDEQFTEFSMSVLVAGIGLVKTCKMFLSRSLKSIQENGHCETDEQVADYDMLSERLPVASELVDDFAAALYPPFDKTEVEQSLIALTNYLDNLVTSFRECHFCIETDDQWLDILCNAIKHNNNKVAALVGAAGGTS